MNRISCFSCKKDLCEFSFENFAKSYKGYLITGRRKPFCNEQCYQEYCKQFYVETYNGSNIYMTSINGQERYIPYMGCPYYFTTLEDCRKRLDKPYTSVVNDSTLHLMFRQF